MVFVFFLLMRPLDAAVEGSRLFFASKIMGEETVEGVKTSRIKQILQEMAADELIVAVGEKNRTYRKTKKK